MGKNDKATTTPAVEAPTAPAAAEETVTAVGVLERLKAKIAGADPFTMDPRVARLRTAGQGIAEMLHKATAARALADTLDANALDLASKALVTLSEVESNIITDAPKKRGRPPGSTNKTASNAAPTSDSPSGNGDANPLAD